MVLYPNKLPESERVCSGICSIKGHIIAEHGFQKIQERTFSGVALFRYQQ